MRPSHAFDPDLHEAGSTAERGGCSHHQHSTVGEGGCSRSAVVSFQDEEGSWQSGCALALHELVDAGAIEPLGQGA